MIIGLMGVGSDGTLYTPSGNKIIKVNLFLCSIIQKIQNKIAVLSWRVHGLR